MLLRMALFKKNLFTDPGISGQESLVQALMSKKRAEPVKRIIPGGKTLLSQVSNETLEGAIYNWLRTCYRFSEVTISMAKDPSKFKLRKELFTDFGTDEDPIWETHKKGKEHLASIIAQAMKQKPVYIHADLKGLWIYKDTENKFSPVSKVTQQDVDDFMHDFKVAKEKNPKLELTAVAVPKVGDSVPAEDWEPYIEFIPKARPEYGR